MSDMSDFLEDQGTGIVGDIYDLVKMVLRLPSRMSAIAQVRNDFLLGHAAEMNRRIERPEPPPPAHIRIKSKPFNKADLLWWRQFNVNEDLLRTYNVTRVAYY